MENSALSRCKLKNDKCGAAYAYDLLRQYGAPTRTPGEAGGTYVARALSKGPFRALRHAGNHTYGFALGTSAERKHMRQLLERGLTPPRRTDPIEAAPRH
jgi:hypothetical protein